jgi:hypothetical protein
MAVQPRCGCIPRWERECISIGECGSNAFSGAEVEIANGNAGSKCVVPHLAGSVFVCSAGFLERRLSLLNDELRSRLAQAVKGIRVGQENVGDTWYGPCSRHMLIDETDDINGFAANLPLADFAAGCLLSGPPVRLRVSGVTLGGRMRIWSGANLFYITHLIGRCGGGVGILAAASSFQPFETMAWKLSPFPCRPQALTPPASTRGTRRIPAFWFPASTPSDPRVLGLAAR